MRKTWVTGSALLLLGVIACVKPKIHRAEQSLRLKSEARESILQKELQDRKAETARLTDQIANLNRTLGAQASDITQLRNELVARTQQMGESAGKLFTEKQVLESKLSETELKLAEKEAVLNRIRNAQAVRKNKVKGLYESLQKAFDKVEGAVVSIEGETITLSLSDKYLFDPGGLNIGTGGKNLLSPLAAFLIERPDLDVDVVSYTDNTLPKEQKTLKDTWEWSLQRAVGIVRMLIREYNVSANQLTPVGRGEFYPLASNETPEGRLKNRRTEIIVRPVLPKVPEE